MTEVDRMGKFHKAIELQGSGTFLLAVNIVGHGAPTEHTEAEPGMIYMDVDSENGDLYKCIKVTITEQGSIWLWKKLVESQELEILKKEIATKANKTGWTANKYLGTDADGNMVEKEAPQTGTGGITEETDPTVPAWAKEPEKPTYTASEVGALPASTEIPANTSDLNNDSGYITIAVATLLNYYLKTEVYAKAETYSQTEVDNLISGLDKRLNAIADSEDVDLDQFSELVAYIKANKSLIDSITTSKVNVADIIDNLTTADSKKPLSAAQGKALKAMYDALPAWAKASTKPTYTKSEVGLGNVDNVRQYSASNPPPYPVKSVNGKTGAVTLGAADVGAATAEQFGQLSKEIADKVSKTGITLGLHSDGKYYIFVDGVPVGTGFELSGNNGDVFGYVDENNNIVLNGSLADGSYNIKYEMEDGRTVDIGNLVLDSNVYYSVTNNLTNCKSSNSDTQVIEGQAYTATITANSGYELKSVTVTMGGNPVTVSGGNINIADITGNIVITAVAEEIKAKYTNLADPTSADWWADSRIGSDGKQRTGATDNVVTNPIHMKRGDIVCIKDLNLALTTNDNNGSSRCGVYYGAAIQSVTTLPSQTPYFSDISASTTGGQATVISDGTDFNVRFAGKPTNGVNNIIITVNEPID